MSDQPLVATERRMSIRVAVLTYNRGKLLEHMLASLAKQDCSDFLCCIFDNGSSDNTPAIVTHYTDCDARFESHRVEENTPAVDNFNRAIRWGVGADSFALLHDDDQLEPEWLGTVAAALKQYPEAALAATNARFIVGKKLSAVTSFSRVTGTQVFKDHPDFVAWLFTYGALVFPAILYRSSAVADEVMRNEGRASDIIFYMRVTRKSGAVLCYEPLFRYRVHPQQDSAGLEEYDVQQLSRFLQTHLPVNASEFSSSARSFITIHRLVALRTQGRGKPFGIRCQLLLRGLRSGGLPLFDAHPRYYARLLMLLMGR